METKKAWDPLTYILRGCVRAPWMSFASKNAVGCAAVAAPERHKARTTSERRDLRYV